MTIKELVDKQLIAYNQKAIFDYKFQTNLRDAPWYEWLNKDHFFECRDDFLEATNKWIHSTKLNTISGLENFTIRDITIGTTQVFDEMYFNNAGKRLRTFRGEYSYHKRVFKNVEFLDDTNGDYLGLEENDWVIISYPFCGVGDIHKHMNTLLDEALEKNITLLVDCAWFGTCRDLDLDFNHPAIKTVCFSLTKGLGLGHLRCGVRYSKEDNDSIISNQNKYINLVMITAQTGLHQMKSFSPDFISNKYYESYLDVCETFGFHKTKCAHVALVDKGTGWDDFIYDELYIKVGLRKIVKEFYNNRRYGY